MNIHNVKLIISAVNPKQYPASVVPEIALAGRSNVGKSSFINKMLNRKNFARTSSHPGKTATINFYDIDNTLHFVDLPGYGYAEVSKKEQERWATMINTYLETRPQLTAVLLLVDSRHKPTKQDVSMCSWIKNQYGFVFVIATKTDKVAKTKLPEHLQVIRDTLCLTDDDILVPFSGETGSGREDAWANLQNICEFEL